MRTSIHVKGAAMAGMLSSQKILHPDDPASNIVPALVEMKAALDAILNRNTIAEAHIPLALRPATYNK